jgi:hypothetical protein
MKVVIIKTKKKELELEDVIEILPNDHKFTEKELSLFTIIDVDDKEIEKMYKDRSDEIKMLVCTGKKPEEYTKKINCTSAGVLRVKEKTVESKP